MPEQRFLIPTPADRIAAQNALAAQVELERLEDIERFNTGQRSRAELPLLDFVPALSPHLQRLDFLQPMAERLEAAERRPIILPSSVAVQHGKTTLLQHWVARSLRRRPTRRFIWASYNDDIALMRSGEIRDLAIAAGCELVSDAKSSWRTKEGGGLDARGVGAGIAGLPAHDIIVDDPYGKRADAESAIVRKSIYEWFKSDIWTRRQPDTSVIVNHARWHTDDLIGRLCAEFPEWAEARLNIPAVQHDGTPTWSRKGQAELLATARALGEYVWWSLYMGEPRGKGQRVFDGVVFYTEPPKEYALAIGIDLAYAAKTSSNWSVAVVLAREGVGAAAKFYVLEVIRKQESAAMFARRLKSLVKSPTENLKPRYAGARFYWHTSSTEVGSADLMRELGGINVLPTVAKVDPFQRAQPVAAAWNGVIDELGNVLAAPRIFVPTHAPWLDDFLAELFAFTGIRDAQDDQVVGLASAYDALNVPMSGVPRAFPSAFSSGNPLVAHSESPFQWR
jgi:phage terminase large subunit-like protein